MNDRQRPLVRYAWLVGKCCYNNLLAVLSIAIVVGRIDVSASDPGSLNVILITVDTFRPDHIGYYGYNKDTSPHLAAFSREGVFFKQAFSSSGWTTPGLISIFTGLYAPTHQVDIRGLSLDEAAKTLPKLLRAAGYRTPDIFFLSGIPNFQNLGLESYSERDRYLPDGDEILFKWLEAEAEKGPFFLYYHYRDLHLPYSPGSPFEEMYLPEAFSSPLGIWGRIRWFLAREKIELVKKNVMILRGDLDFDQLDHPWVNALYDGEIKRMDELFFKRLRDTLDSLKLRHNTLLIISADHGEELMDHGLVGHVSTYREGRLYDEVVRIPLIFWLPGVINDQVVVNELVQNIDVAPTVLDLLGLEQPEEMPGQSLLPLMNGTAGWRSRPVYLETSEGGYTANTEQYKRRYRAVRTQRWKLIHDVSKNEFVLFDLQSDPAESANVVFDHPHVADSLRTLLHQWVFFSQPRPTPKETAQRNSVRTGDRFSGAPRIIFPVQGDSLQYRGEDYTIQLGWTGDPQSTYNIEYVIGKEAYHLQGVMEQSGSKPSFGPYQEMFWNSLALYNPFKFRVFKKDRPDAKSEWVTFHLVSTEAASTPVSLWFSGMALASAAPSVMERLVSVSADLVIGLCKGLRDLLLWMGSATVTNIAAYALMLAIAAAILAPTFERLGKAKTRAWLLAVLYVAFVYATIPLLPRVWEVLNGYTGGTVRHLGIVAVMVAVLCAIGFSWRPLCRNPWSSATVLLLVLSAYGYLLDRFAVYPAERLHLVEYGFVSFLLFRALALHMEGTKAYVASFLLTVVIGFGDEVIQWVLPNRYFELKDVQLNAVSGGLGLLLVRFVMRPNVAVAGDAETEKHQSDEAVH